MKMADGAESGKRLRAETREYRNQVINGLFHMKKLRFSNDKYEPKIAIASRFSFEG